MIRQQDETIHGSNEAEKAIIAQEKLEMENYERMKKRRFKELQKQQAINQREEEKRRLRMEKERARIEKLSEKE